MTEKKLSPIQATNLLVYIPATGLSTTTKYSPKRNWSWWCHKASSSSESNDTVPLYNKSSIISENVPSLTSSSSSSSTIWRRVMQLFLLIVTLVLFAIIVSVFHANNFSFEAFLIRLWSNRSLMLFGRSARCNNVHSSQMVNSKVLTDEMLHQVLRNDAHMPVLQLATYKINAHTSEDGPLFRCAHHSCFDIYRCNTGNIAPFSLPKLTTDTMHSKPQRIKVYVYPSQQYKWPNTGEMIRLPMSVEFSRILHAIVRSPYYTKIPKEACLFVPNIDLLNAEEVNPQIIERVLWSLPSFAEMQGSNHILYTMLLPRWINDQSHFGIDIGNSAVAGAGFDNVRYRPNFDISIPAYSQYNQLYEDSNYQLKEVNVNAINALPRPWKVITTQMDTMPAKIRFDLQQLQRNHSKHELLLLGFDTCVYSNQLEPIARPDISALFATHWTNSTMAEQYRQTMVCNAEHQIRSRYIDMLHSARFCLILSDAHLVTTLLNDVLMSGCIPVIMVDHIVLPFEERIDWTLISIRVWEHDAVNLFSIFKSISPQRENQLRSNCVYIWQRFFASLESIVLTTLDIINERIFPGPRNITFPQGEKLHNIKRFSFDYYNKGLAYLTPKETFLQTDTFTAVILSYNRVKSLFEVILSVSRAPSCSKVLVVWNNPKMMPPTQWPTVKVPIEVVMADENKLSNRFYPYTSIQTEGIFAIDDDITILSEDEIEFAYQTWRQFPDRIVGFPSRLHYWNNLTHTWGYDSEWRNQASMVLTGAAFYHNFYNTIYTYLMPDHLRQWIDHNMSCEDIAMNFLIANITGNGPVKVTPRKKFKCPECAHNSKLSTSSLLHLQKRSKCVNYFAQIFKSMPLRSVEFRSCPVLYRDNIPEKFKNYHSIGNL